MDAALTLHEERLHVYEALGDRRGRAVTLGDIARIKTAKGEVDAALTLHEERVQVFEALGDRRERAVTLGDIARIKRAKGEVDAALTLHEERATRLRSARRPAGARGDAGRHRAHQDGEGRGGRRPGTP